jgi:hypothetical protein
MEFTNFYVTPMCSTSRAELLTGTAAGTVDTQYACVRCLLDTTALCSTLAHALWVSVVAVMLQAARWHPSRLGARLRVSLM